MEEGLVNVRREKVLRGFLGVLGRNSRRGWKLVLDGELGIGGPRGTLRGDELDACMLLNRPYNVRSMDSTRIRG